MPEKVAARIKWFIRLRWLAAVGVFVFIMVGRFLLRLEFAFLPLALVGVSIVLYNTGFLFIARRIQSEGKWGERFASLQVGMDILALTVLMHYGGGIENPFIPYYFFHTIIAAILLPWRKMDIQVFWASVCIIGVATAELRGLLPHHHITGLLPFELYNNWKFVAVAIFAIITTLVITSYLAASISQRLHERERQLAKNNVLLAEQDRIKSRYVMRVAHDLAEPAGMITSCLKLVTQGLTGSIPEKSLDMVQRAQHKSEYLGDLVRDLLSLSRIKATRKIPKFAVQLKEIVRQVFEDLEPHVIEKSLILEQNLPANLPAVYGNADAIHELIGNLVANAVKYAIVGGQVKIDMSNTGNEVLVKIEDNGVGIPVEAVPHIFEEFYRADNVRAEAVEGTGLGLSIVQQILNTHDGKIWVESEQDKGTTFSFTLPIDRGSHA